MRCKQALGEICNGKINTKNDKNQSYDNEFIEYGSFNTKALFPDLTDAMLLQGCISCGPCSYPELTEDHVLPSA